MSKGIKKRLYYDGDKVDMIAMKKELNKNTDVYYLFGAYDSGEEAVGLLYDDGNGIHVKTDKIDIYLDYSEVDELKILLDCRDVGDELQVRKAPSKPYRRFQP